MAARNKINLAFKSRGILDSQAFRQTNWADCLDQEAHQTVPGIKYHTPIT